MMSVIVFPLLCRYCYFGDCFNLSTYKLYRYENPYSGVNRRNFTSKVDIDTLTSEYKVVQSSAELAKFMGMDAVSYLKMKYDLWHSGPDPYLFENISPRNIDKVIRIGVKISLKAINETIYEGHPTFPEWENRDNLKGTHYLKSIIYGSQMHSVILFLTYNHSHFQQLKRAINREIGSNGTFNESIPEKIRKIERKLNVRHFITSLHFYGMEFEHHGQIIRFADLLEVKKNLEGNRSFVSDYEKLLFEFHSLSELFPTLPSVEIKGTFIVKANQLLLIFEDTLIASDELDYFLEEKMKKEKYKYKTLEESSQMDGISEEYEMYRMAKEDYRRCKDLEEELNILKEKIGDLVKNIDITTRGNVHQFDEVFWYYNSSSSKKYRKKVHQLINDIAEVE